MSPIEPKRASVDEDPVTSNNYHTLNITTNSNENGIIDGELRVIGGMSDLNTSQ